MTALWVLSILLSMLEEMTLMILPLVFLRFSVQPRLPSLFLISFLVALSSPFIREYFEVSYAIFLLMLLFYVLFILILRFHPVHALIVLCMGYLTNTAIMAVILCFESCHKKIKIHTVSHQMLRIQIAL